MSMTMCRFVVKKEEKCHSCYHIYLNKKKKKKGSFQWRRRRKEEKMESQARRNSPGKEFLYPMEQKRIRSSKERDGLPSLSLSKGRSPGPK
jgi:hypothetical protein